MPAIYDPPQNKKMEKRRANMDNIRITGSTRLTGLLGSPVSHSVSPLMHNTAFQLCGLDYVYLCFDVKENELKSAINGLQALGARGFNLTMPVKNQAVYYMDDLTPAAALTEAVNTVVCEADGSLIGHNTDGVGYMEALYDAGVHVIGKEITLLGSGGAATAIIAQAALDGVKTIDVFFRPDSRFAPRMKRLACAINSALSCKVLLHEHGDTAALKDALSRSVLLTNATSVGMAPDADQSLITDLSVLHPKLIVSDVIYNPRQTRLMMDASSVGCLAMNGMYMLLYQGAAAFRLWTGQEMPVEQIKEKILADASFPVK